MKKINSYFLITRKKIPVYLKYYIYRNSKQGKLPSEYQQIEYIESTGTQYIDTGVNADNKMGIETKLLWKYGRFGAYQSTNNARYHLYDNGTFGFGISDNFYGVKHEEREIYTIKCNFYNNYKYIDNGVETNTLPNTAFDTSLSFWLFRRNPSLIFTGRIYYFKITYENELVRNMIPCYRKSDNVIGMYDLVTNTFFTNAGTGEFLKGSNVPT